MCLVQFFFFPFRVGITMVFDLLGEKRKNHPQTLCWFFFFFENIFCICIECCWGQQDAYNLKESDVIPTSLILYWLTPFLLGKTLYSNEMGWESNGLWDQKGTHPGVRPQQVLVHLSLRMWLSLGPIVLNKRNRSSMKKETRLVVCAQYLRLKSALPSP